jgi:hypothetical protein
MGRVYEEFNYSIPNLLLLSITLPVSRWIEEAGTPFGIGLAVTMATAGSACRLMGRVLYVDLKLSRFSRVVALPGLTWHAVAGLLAWAAAWMIAEVNRWQRAGILFVVGVIYWAGTVVLLDRRVLTDEEEQKGDGIVNRGLALFSGRGATA